MERSLWLPIGFAIAGLLLIIGSFSMRLSKDERGDARPLAWTEPVFGTVTVKSRGDADGRELRKRGTVRKGDTVETMAESEVRLGFTGGEELRLLENTVATLDLEGGRPVLIVKSGHYDIEKTGQGDMLLAQDGERHTLAELVQLADAKARSVSATPVTALTAKKAKAVSSVPDPRAWPEEMKLERAKGLTPDYIRETLKSQQSLFFKCYTQLLQKKPGITGDASVTFVIERNGKVGPASIASSSLQDPLFKDCLVQAVKRVEFKSFAGEPVSTLFPLRFE